MAYYSPTEAFGGKEKLQALTAIGRVRTGEPYLFDMGGGFKPYRPDVDWAQALETSIRPLLESLAFTAGDKGWGYQLRFGLFEIEDRDMDCIAAAIGAVGSVGQRPLNASGAQV